MTTTKMITFNCKNVVRSVDCIRSLCQEADLIALQETWLLPHDLSFLGTIDDNFAFTGTSAVDTSVGVLRGRPYGGVALLWRKTAFPAVTVINCTSVRLAAVKISLSDRSFVVFSVYMPTDCSDNLLEFTECLSEINAVIESNSVESVFILGDFNAHPGELFANELLSFCSERLWSCVDMNTLPSDTYTYVSDAHGCLRWLDHCVVTDAALPAVISVSVLYDSYWSDHIPVLLQCKFNNINKHTILRKPDAQVNKVIWGERDAKQITNYHDYCHAELRQIDFPSEFSQCADMMCNDTCHLSVLDDMYNNIERILVNAARNSYCQRNITKHRPVTGWNKYVRDAHERARLYYKIWLMSGKPSSGPILDNMRESRKKFKCKLKWCQANQNQIKMDIIAKHHSNKDFGKFWKSTNKLNHKPSLPVSVEGEHDQSSIADLFRQHFRVQSPLNNEPQLLVPGSETVCPARSVTFTTKQIATTIKNMVRGKSPGHDGLSIEHLQHAGIHLPRVLCMFVNLCLGHSYLPEKLMRTIVVPIIKNKTSDSSVLSNYRPISLATIVAKVLDSLLVGQLDKHLKINDAQFGFRPGLSTESAILCLKQTVQYYTARKTPVFACYLDLSKAFDLVAYTVLWDKLQHETDLPREIINMFKFWYANQQNRVRWANSFSAEYRLECGVRQGGLSSPALFNLYMNNLIDELSRTGIGCHIDGVCINNISYADDMVLLSPSVRGLRKLIEVCESYAGTHGLKYNSTKSELMVFKAGSKSYNTVPPVMLCGRPLNRVANFKYLGHLVSDDLKDNADIERERRSLAVRCGMLARRFARCTAQVKVTLFKAYCQSFYTCSLWVDFTQRAYGGLRTQYNNTFRVLMGLPRFCSASGMFADANVDSFSTIMRKRCASMLRRFRDSPNTILRALAERWDSPILGRWIRLHAVK